MPLPKSYGLAKGWPMACGQPPPELKALALTNRTVAVGSAPGTIIGAIQNTTSGATLAVSAGGDRAVLDASGNLVVGPVAAERGVFDVTLTETLPRAINPVRSTTIKIGAYRTGSDMALGGDSRMVNTYDRATNDIQQGTGYVMVWTLMLYGQLFDRQVVAGTSGISSTTLVNTYLPQALARNAAFGTELIGVNDPGAGISTATTFANLKAYCDAMTANGTRMFLFTDPGAQGFTAAQVEAFHGAGGLNDQIRAYAAANPLVILIDWVDDLLSSKTYPITFKPGYILADGTHFDTTGSYMAARFVGPKIQAYLPARTPPDPAGAGQLLTNADFATATGGTIGTGNQGVLPSGYTGSRNSPCVGTFSVVTLGSGAKAIRAALASTGQAAGTVGGCLISKSFTPSVLTAGAKYRGECLIEVPAGTSTSEVYGQLNLNMTDASFVQAYQARSSSQVKSNVTMLSDTTFHILVEATVPAGKTISTANFQFGVKINGAGSATVDFHGLLVKKL